MALERSYCSLPVPEGACKKAGEGLFTRACKHVVIGHGVMALYSKRVDLDWIQGTNCL